MGTETRITSQEVKIYREIQRNADAAMKAIAQCQDPALTEPLLVGCRVKDGAAL